MTPTPGRSDLPATMDDRTLLMTFLRYARATAVAKCDGLTDEQAAVAPLETSPLMTMAGVVSHLRWVEWSWFTNNLLGDRDPGPWTDPDQPDIEFTLGTQQPLATVLAEYEQQCSHFDDLVAGMDLDMQAAVGVSEGPVTLRWILMHLVEETSRHNGHLDVLRELVDGTTGS